MEEAKNVFDWTPIITSLLTVTATIGGSIITLIGVWLANKNSYKLEELKIKSQEKQKLKEISLSKLEELFTLFSKYNSDYELMIHTRYSYLSDIISKEVYEKLFCDINKDISGFSRINLLINIYFEDLLLQFKEMQDVKKLISFFISHEKKDKESLDKFMELIKLYDDKNKLFLHKFYNLSKSINSL